MSLAERHGRLAVAARDYDFVDLEDGLDLTPDLLAKIPPARRRISWHGPATDVIGLADRFERMEKIPARLYLLAPRASELGDGLAPLQLLRSLRRTDVTAFATGIAGTWSRILAPRLGALVVYGRLHEAEENGVPTVGRLALDFGLPAMPPLRDLYGIVGGSVTRSLAPRIYNQGFRALGLPALCLPFSTAEFGPFWNELVEAGLPSLGAPVRGLTVVTPHKEEALTTASLTTERAREAGAANSLVRAGHAWHGATTTRIDRPLAGADVPVAGRRVAVIGCGGAGRSIAVELRRHGARVTIVNRGAPRAEYASDHLDLPWISLPDFSAREFDLVVNATPVVRECPFDVSQLGPGGAVADLAYVAGGETALVRETRRRGLVAVDGREVLAAETSGQFELMTGQPMPADALTVARGWRR